MFRLAASISLSVLCSVFVFSAQEARALWGAEWKTSIPIGSETTKVEHDFSWRRAQSRAKADLSPEFSLSDLKSADQRPSILRSLDEKAKAAAKAPGELSKDLLTYNYTFGIIPLNFSWSKYTRNNENAGYRGVLIGGLGYYSKNYFNPPKMHSWNGFWHWGTVYLIIPWIGLGTEYTTEKFYFEIGTIYFIPYPGFGFHF